MNTGRVVVAIYTDPDFYPPTINAIINLSAYFKEVAVVTRNNSVVNYPFPKNVVFHKTGKYITVADAEKKSIGYKMYSFVQFLFQLYVRTANSKTNLLLLYDPFPLLAYSLVRRFIPKRVVTWYHNHDMPDKRLTKKFTLGWFAAAKEHAAMEHIDYFSLPSQDRLAFYTNWKKLSSYFFIPNYPSLQVYTNALQQSKPNGDIRIIFQGAIGEGHALEEIIALLKENINNRVLHLILKGPVREPYKQQLIQLAADHGVSAQLTWIGIGPYADMPKITSSCHIGIAIYMGKDNVSRTLGTASNKIYEYAASGLPVILYDDIQFTKYLKDHPWTFFTDGSINGLSTTIKTVIAKMNETRELAKADYRQTLNFEKAFIPALETVIKNSNQD